jgi:hypothetical protein
MRGSHSWQGVEAFTRSTGIVVVVVVVVVVEVVVVVFGGLVVIGACDGVGASIFSVVLPVSR